MCRIFYEPVDIEILYDLLDEICLKTDKYYQYNELAFRKMVFQNMHPNFLNRVLPFYRENKQLYITREISPNMFFTIIKQICNANNIPIESKTNKLDGGYRIEHHIFHSATPNCLCRRNSPCRRCRAAKMGIPLRDLPIRTEWDFGKIKDVKNIQT